MPTIPKPNVCALDEITTDEFAMHGKYDMLLALKMDGGVDVYIKREHDPKHPEQYRTECAYMDIQTGAKELYDEFAGKFVKVGPSKRKDKEARMKTIMEDRRVITTLPIAWQTLHPIPGGNCGYVLIGGHCYVTP